MTKDNGLDDSLCIVGIRAPPHVYVWSRVNIGLLQLG